jgi:hypothetical protein
MNFNCIFTFQTLLEAIAIGLITLAIGKFAFFFTDYNVDNNTDNNVDKKKKKKEKYLNLLLFITGFILHYVIEIINLNKWYCDKKCINGLLNIVKL